MNHINIAKQPLLLNRRLALSWLALLLISFVYASMTAMAAVAPADSLISNQASMSFTDAEGNTRTVTSDVVQIRVRQVYRLTLEADNSTFSDDGATVTFNHVLTNTGNGEDSFSLTVADVLGDDFNFDDIRLFVDDGTGNPGAPINGDITLNPGEEIRIVIEVDIPANTDDDRAASLELTATSANDPAADPFTQINTDTVTVTSNAVIDVVKELRDSNGNVVSSGDPGSGPFTFNLILSNDGSIDSGAIDLTDVLDAAFIYQNSSATYTAAPSGLTDAADGDEGGIDYQFGDTSGSGTITVSIDSLAQGATETLAFMVDIDTDAVADIATNQVDFSYDDGTGNVETDRSNEVPFTVNQVGNPEANDTAPDGDPRSNTDAGAAGDDEVLIESAAQGDTIQFENIITNSGNGTDTFDIEVDTLGSTFPANTNFSLLGPDGATPMQDSNGNGTLDTGPLEPGESFIVVLSVSLPNDAAGDNGGNGFAVSKTAISEFDPTQTNTVTDRLNQILANSVDLTNDVSVNDGAQPGDNTTGGDGAGIGPEGDYVRQNTADAGTTTTFNLVVNNTGAGDDNYAFSEPVLPGGWTVTYYLDDGDGIRNDGDTLIDTGKTGSVPAGDDVLVFADVAVPSDAAEAEYQVNFAITSPTTGSSDEIRDSVVVNETHAISITPADNEGTVFPAGQVVYSHTISNDGNVDEEVFLNVANSQAGWETVIYIDDGDGVLGPGDTVLNPGDPLPVGIGEEVTILVEVTAPDDSQQDDQNITTITGSFNDGNDSFGPVTETTTVTSGDADLDKQQALDADCDGTADTTFGDAILNPAPNECVIYQITATNSSTVTLTDLTISDTTPAFTSYETCSGACVATSTTGTLSTPAQGSGGEVSSSFNSLPPNASEVLTFTVRLNNQ